MNIIFFGPPGAGKGTQAEIVSKTLNIPTISTGAMIRDAIANQTKMGLEAKSYTESGALVPDSTVVGIVKERLAQPDCANGFILDGFPRTIPQAEALDDMGVQIDKVVDIDVSDAEIVHRLSGRRVCERCGDTYHMDYNKPKVENVCNACGGTLIQRKDDSPETVQQRLAVYHEQTQPLEDYYKNQGKLSVVSGEGEIEEITRLTIAALEG